MYKEPSIAYIAFVITNINITKITNINIKKYNKCKDYKSITNITEFSCSSKLNGLNVIIEIF